MRTSGLPSIVSSFPQRKSRRTRTPFSTSSVAAPRVAGAIEVARRLRGPDLLRVDERELGFRVRERVRIDPGDGVRHQAGGALEAERDVVARLDVRAKAHVDPRLR